MAMRMRGAALVICSAAVLSGCKDKEKPPEPQAAEPAEIEITGKCKELLDHVSQVTAPAAGAGVIDQVKARAAARLDAKTCQKGTLPEAQITCLLAAKSQADVDACHKK